MNRQIMLVGGVVALMFVAPAAALELNLIEVKMKPWELVHCDSPEVEAAAAAGLDPYTHVWPDPQPFDPDMTVTLHLLCLETLEQGLPLETDCTATSYTHTGWKWTTVENFVNEGGAGISSSTARSIFQTSGDTWDNQVAANIFGSMSTGSGSVPVFNGVNLLEWQDLASGTIASAWTWSSGGIASESDHAYNTDFGWSTSGASGKMDLQNIATHEFGHTFGMGHSSSTSSNSCLTMYPSGSLGETQKRTLGDGDINGIKARYP